MSSIESDEILTEEDIFKEINDQQEEYNTNIPNYVTLNDDETKELLKTEILQCEKCGHHNIIGTEPFNRRQKELVQMKLDNITTSDFFNFCKRNKLDKNAGMTLLLMLVKDESISKMLERTFANISKRKGSRIRSKTVLNE